MSLALFEKKVNALSWYHRIDLGNGIITPGTHNTARHLSRYGFPNDLSGKSVIDIGAFNGFFTFEAIRRNASSLLALDQWTGLHRAPLENFELAREALGMEAATCDMSVYEMTRENVGLHDISFFLGVLYHLRHPQLGLDKVSAVTGETMIIETYIDALTIGKPAAIYYRGDTLNNDATNYWGINPMALEAMIIDAGFAHCKPISLYYASHQGRGEWSFTQPNESMTQLVSRKIDEGCVLDHARAVYHAYK